MNKDRSQFVAALIVVCFLAGHSNCETLAGEPPPPKATQTHPNADNPGESWGWELAGLRTRLAPDARQFTLGQPMMFRLELKNFGRDTVSYDPQAMDVNDSLEVRDPQGRAVRYISGSFQTLSRLPLPLLAPGKTATLFDRLDLASQYLIIKPGMYTVQFRGISDAAEAAAKEQCYRRIAEQEAKDTGEKVDWRKTEGALIPKSNSVVIDVQPGTIPAAKRIAARLLDVLPREWQMSVHGYTGETNCPAAWRTAPPGWVARHPLPSITLECSVTRYKQDTVRAHLWIADGKLVWTGRVDAPGQRAAVFLGPCADRYIYVDLPSHTEATAAKWPALENELRKLLLIRRLER